ncbi:MAG: YdaU family protein [Sphingobium sp.]
MSKEASAWMPFYIGDYLGDTQRLTTEQHGAYFLLILDYWRNGPAPDDDAVLMQITKLDKAGWKRCRPALSRLFQIGDDEWRHKRIEKELTKAKANAERRSEKASKAAQARWGDAPSNAPSMPQAMLGECPPPSPSSEANASPRERVSGLMLELCGIASIAPPDPGCNFDKHKAALDTVEGWMEAGADPALIRDTLTKRCANLRATPKSLAFFDKPVREAAEARKAETSRVSEHTGALIDQILKRSAA